ncbi:hypothetical protein WH47_01304 [Habropoda laboriosa]|uniref:Uncharacterized protein n=1 Tax=Habropoda laboriosa TaxID=597456 RepID=A0A0L7QZD2_9HYME|nr:hypothetical protein WH47_01304 [Habropoda laboriosa]
MKKDHIKIGSETLPFQDISKSRSADLSPSEFYLWGHLKILVHDSNTITTDNLRNQIIPACDKIRNKPETFDSLRQHLRRVNILDSVLDLCLYDRSFILRNSKIRY